MATEGEKSVSDLTADEAYLRFIECADPDDPAYNASFERLQECLFSVATQYAWKLVGGKKDNKNHADVVEDAVWQSFAKIVRQQRKDKNQRTGATLKVWSLEEGQQNPTGKFVAWYKTLVHSSLMDQFRKQGKAPIQTSVLDAVNKEGEVSSFADQYADPETERPHIQALELQAAELEALQRCRDALEDPLRTIIFMIVEEQRTQTEIAEQFETSNAKITRLKKTAFSKIADCMRSSS